MTPPPRGIFMHVKVTQAPALVNVHSRNQSLELNALQGLNKSQRVCRYLKMKSRLTTNVLGVNPRRLRERSNLKHPKRFDIRAKPPIKYCKHSLPACPREDSNDAERR
jgi:hypothetical protein